jgi:hypothetical protein
MMKEDLLKLLATQVKHAHSFDGAFGKVEARRAACNAANETIARLEELGIPGEEALEEAQTILGW